MKAALAAPAGRLEFPGRFMHHGSGSMSIEPGSLGEPMTTPHARVQKHLAGLEEAGILKDIEKRLAKLSPEQQALPHTVPHKPEQTAERLALLAQSGGALPALRGQLPQPTAEALAGNIENFIGMAQVPVGLIGPLRVRGAYANGDFYVPLATSEGALVASYGRGARLLSLAGGASCVSLPGWVQRAPGFVFADTLTAARFAAWVAGEFEALQTAAATRTRHGALVQVAPHVEANHVHLVLGYTTGEAAGQNMVTLCTEAVCQDILARAPFKPRYWFLEANMSGDKKATIQSLLNTRGRKVVAEALLPAALVHKVLHTTVERLCDYWRMSFIGGVQSGSVGVSGHVANGLAALFLATGQDIACVAEASIGITRLERSDEGDLYAAVTLPNLIVGSVGGGTRLPTAVECLGILGCSGPGSADKLAEIAAAACLGGELSIIGALCSGDFAGAHAKLGRAKPGVGL
jgi:hydroxymethylglutaryl-CoA reductase (NADPH)